MCVHVYGALIQLPHQIKTDSENYDVNLRQEIESGCKLNPSHCFMSPCQSKFCFNRSVTVWVLVFNKSDDRCQSLDQMNYPILIPIKKKKWKPMPIPIFSILLLNTCTYISIYKSAKCIKISLENFITKPNEFQTISG